MKIMGYTSEFDYRLPFGYDPAGNTTSDAERTLTYNAFNLPSSITATETTITNRYLGGTAFARTDQDGKTRYYLDGLEVYDGKAESYAFGEGRLAFRTAPTLPPPTPAPATSPPANPQRPVR